MSADAGANGFWTSLGGLLGGIVTPGSGYVRPRCRLGSGREVGDGPVLLRVCWCWGLGLWGGWWGRWDLSVCWELG